MSAIIKKVVHQREFGNNVFAFSSITSKKPWTDLSRVNDIVYFLLI